MASALLIALSMLLTMLGAGLPLLGNPRMRRGKGGVARLITLAGAAVVFALAAYRLAAA